jgi:hypothetical protein
MRDVIIGVSADRAPDLVADLYQNTPALRKNGTHGVEVVNHAAASLSA